MMNHDTASEYTTANSEISIPWIRRSLAGHRLAMTSGPMAMTTARRRDNLSHQIVSEPGMAAISGKSAIVVSNPRTICSTMMVRPPGTRSVKPLFGSW